MRIATRVASIVAALSFALAAAPACAFPSLWVAKGDGGTVYLFGTVHLLPPDLKWRSPQFDRALRESTELWTEAVLPVAPGAVGFDPAALQRVRQLTLQLGMQTEAPLSSRLTTREAEAMRAIAGRAGIQPAALDHMRPWFAATMLGGANNRRIGWSPTAGADVVISTEAQAAGKPMRAFETDEEQLRMLAGLPPEVELAYLRKTIALSADAQARFAELAQAWSNGEDDRIETLVSGSVRGASPELYERVSAARTRAWAPKVAELLETPGVKFVAVGGGHLVGDDGLVSLLRARGVRVERVAQTAP